MSTWEHTLLIDMGAFYRHIWRILRWSSDPKFPRKIDIGLLTLPGMGFWTTSWYGGGGWKCPQGRMATEANWGQCRGYQSWQILFLTSFPICRAFEKSPMLYSFAVRGRRSHLLSPRKIISFSVYENPNFVNFWVIWTICTSNQSWEHSEFKFDMKKCHLLWKIRRKSIFSI